MQPLTPAQPLFAVLIIPPRGCPTKEVYQAFDAGHQHQPARDRTDWPRCARATASELNDLLVNDLEPAAFAVAPWLAELQRQAAEALARPIHVTGSGSTLFTLCASGQEADEVHAQFAAALPCPSVPVRIGG